MLLHRIKVPMDADTLAVIRQRAAAVDLSIAGYLASVVAQHAARKLPPERQHVPDWVRPAQTGEGRRPARKKGE